MATDDELVLEISELLFRLSEEGHLELAAPRGATSIAIALVAALGRSRDMNISEWLLERPEVAELYLDSEELTPMLAGLLGRMENPDPVPRHDPELAAAILASPTDVQARLVYADWLHEQGDPRGELIMVQAQLARASDEERARLERVERALLGRYRKYFYGDLDGGARQFAQFRYGFIDKATIGTETALETLLSLESARFLRHLTLYVALTPLGAALKKRALPASLAVLRIGAVNERGRGTIDVGRATRGLTRLERLEVSASTIVLGDVALPSLRTLALRAGVLRFTSEVPLANFTGLESLHIASGTFRDRDDAYKADLFAWLFDAPPPRLSTLRLTFDGASRRDYLPRLLRSSLATQLRTLDLSKNPLDPSDLQELLASAPLLTNLERLDLRGTALYDDVSHEAARRLCKEVLLGPHTERMEPDDEVAEG